MSIAELVGLGVVTGLGAGLLAGLVGIGGGVVIVPAVYYGLTSAGALPNDAAHIAVATSLASIVPASVVSFAKHLKSGHADLGFLRDWGPGIVLGVAAAQIVAPYLDGRCWRRFCRPLSLFAYRFAFPDRFAPVLDAPPGGFFRHCASLGSAPVGTGRCWRWILTNVVMTLSGLPMHKSVGACGNRHRRQHPRHGGGGDGDALLQSDPARQHRSRNLAVHRAGAGCSRLVGCEHRGARERTSPESGLFSCAHNNGGGDVAIRYLALTCAGPSCYRPTARSGRLCGACFANTGVFTRKPVSGRFYWHRSMPRLVTPSFNFGRVGDFDGLFVDTPWSWRSAGCALPFSDSGDRGGSACHRCFRDRFACRGALRLRSRYER